MWQVSPLCWSWWTRRHYWRSERRRRRWGGGGENVCYQSYSNWTPVKELCVRLLCSFLIKRVSVTFCFLLSQIEEEKKKKKEEAARKKQEQEVDHMFPRSDVSSSSSVSQTMNTFTHSLLLLFRWLNWRRWRSRHVKCFAKKLTSTPNLMKR